MLKNNKFNKFVSVLCSSLVLSSVAPVIKHVHADPLFTITKSADGKECLKLTENVLFVVVTARDIEQTKQMYENMICDGLRLDKQKQTFDIEAIPEQDLYQNLLKLIAREKMDRPVALVVDFSNTKQPPKNHNLPYAFVLRTQTEEKKSPERLYELTEEMPEESSLAWPETELEDIKETDKAWKLSEKTTEANLTKLFLVIDKTVYTQKPKPNKTSRPMREEEITAIVRTRNHVRDLYDLKMSATPIVDLRAYNLSRPLSENAPFYLTQLKTVSVGQLLNELPRSQQPNMAPAIN